MDVLHNPVFLTLCLTAPLWLWWFITARREGYQAWWARVVVGEAKRGVCTLRANEYMHIEDVETGEVFTVLGPMVFPLLSNHKTRFRSPRPCVVLGPDEYVRIRNPVHRHGPENPKKATGPIPEGRLVCLDKSTLRVPTRCDVRLGEREVRLGQTSFPLFPGEIMEHRPRRRTVVKSGEALLLLCLRDFPYTVEQHGEDGTGTSAVTRWRKQGEKYYLKGPAMHTPRIEELDYAVVKPIVLTASQALYLKAKEALDEVVDEHTGATVRRHTGECWTVRFCGEYYPPPNAEVYNVAEAVPLHAGMAIRVEARGDFIDHYTGTPRRRGEQWLVTTGTTGGRAYVPSHLETVVCADERPILLEPQQYCIVRNPATAAERAGTLGKHVDAAAESDEAETGSSHSEHPQDDASGKGEVCYGKREVRVGPCSFFLEDPLSSLSGDVCHAFTLTVDEALLVEAALPFREVSTGVERPIASRWLVRGPTSYVPPVEVRVIERRRVIHLSPNEGVYVRNTQTGEIRAVYGTPFMLSEEEELWEKPVSRYTRRLMQAPRLCIRAQEEPDIIGDWEQSTEHDAAVQLSSSRPHSRSLTFVSPPPTEDATGAPVIREQPRDTRPFAVVSVDVEANTLVRLHDTNSGASRVVAGPAAATLGPYEEFTSLTLSGGRPKQPNQIHTLSLFLGPDYMSDMIEVETLDHARLKLELAYNWEFDCTDMEGALKRVFTLPDFTGEACKTLASRIRVAIASSAFESFHRNSASVIRQAIFSATAADSSTELRGDALYFLVNGLRITSVDLQSVEPVDPKTRAALAKSVQLAVEIITRSQENEASHHAARIEQEARGALERQVVRDGAAAEEERVSLMEVMVRNATIEQTGVSKVQALAESEAHMVEAQAELNATPLRCTARELEIDAELAVLQERMEKDLAHRQALNELQGQRAAALANIEAAKYEHIMAALGIGTIEAIARAGPELKAQMLAALGLQGFLVTDGSSPVNLLDVASEITEGGPVQKR